MALQQFVLIVVDIDDDALDALFERCDDIVVERNRRRPGAEVIFDRDAPSLIDAIVSGVRDLDMVGVAAAQVRDDDDLVTLGTVAERVGRSREAVRLWSVGRTGPGGFPAPVDTKLSTAYYRWSQVAPWLRERMGMAVNEPEPTLAAINLALQLRAMAPKVARMDAVRSLIAA